MARLSRAAVAQHNDRILAQLLARGFDNSTADSPEPGCTVCCSQCAAVAINGVACHESRCPNQRHECAECDTLISGRARLCESCANPEPDPDWYDERAD